MKTDERIQRICPKCGAYYTEHPALSRHEGVGYICPDCGVRESHESMGVEIDEQEKILGIIHSRCSAE